MEISVEGIVLPNKPLTNFELIDAVDKLKIHDFRGVFLRNTLPKKAKNKECGILNLDDSNGSGTHWVAWSKNAKEKVYFDSFGIQPPTELINYLHSPVKYTTEQIQPRGQVFCGHLCLFVLKHLSAGENLQNIVNGMY